MKVKLLTPLILGGMLFFQGCGPEDADKNKEMEFKSSGEFDMVDYISASNVEKQTFHVINYVKDGEKRTEDTPIEHEGELYYTYKRDGNKIESYVEASNVVADYTHFATTEIKEDRIETMLYEHNKIYTTTRFANIGDLVSETEAGKCYLVKHLDTMTVRGVEYEDILKLSCRSDTQNRSKKVDSGYDSYIAYGIGGIYTNAPWLTHKLISYE